MWTSLLCWVSVFWDLNCLPHTLQTKSQIIIVNFGFDPTQVSVSLRLDSKAVKFSYFWWPEQLIKCQTSYRNLWLSVLLWDLGGLKGKIIAQNMGTKIGLTKHIYFVIFCAGWRLRRRRRPAAWFPGAGGEDTEVEAVEPGVGDTISSLVLVRPMEVVIERVALPPVSSTLWKISNSPVNSSLILLQISELNGARIGAQFGRPLTMVVKLLI